MSIEKEFLAEESGTTLDEEVSKQDHKRYYSGKYGVAIPFPMYAIREIWDEMKELKRLHGGRGNVKEENRRWDLMQKYEEVDTLFGHESTLDKAIIYYLNEYGKDKNQMS